MLCPQYLSRSQKEFNDILQKRMDLVDSAADNDGESDH